MLNTKANNAAIQRLTALWALAESGLGGWMHALHLPLTGMFVGGAAVVLVALIARYSNCSYRQVMQATLLVLLVKFVASPQSPPQAYVAVGFQGVAGAVLYRLIPNFTIASVLFATVAMLESAVQKLLFLTLIYGNPLWEALDAFFASIIKSFSLPGDMSFSYWLILSYTGLYTIWGVVLGIWIAGLPARLKDKAESVALAFRDMQAEYEQMPGPGKKRRNRLVPIAITVVLISAALLLSGNYGLGKVGYVLLRTIAALILIFGIINPAVKMLLQRWLHKSKSRHKASLEGVLNLLPGIRRQVGPAYKMAAMNNRGIRRYPAFLFILIIITVYPTDEPTQNLHIHQPGT